MQLPDTNSPLSFRFEIDPAEYARGVRALARWSSYRWLALPVAALPFVPMVMQAITSDGRWMTPPAASPFIAIPIIAYLWFGPTGYRFRVRRAKRASPILQAEQRLEFARDGLHTSAGPAAGFMAWSGILHVREDAEFYFFYYTERCAYYLPKRVIQSDALDDGLRSFIRAHAPDRGAELAQDAASVPSAT